MQTAKVLITLPRGELAAVRGVTPRSEPKAPLGSINAVEHSGVRLDRQFLREVRDCVAHIGP